MNVAEVVGRVLAAAGVDTAFGVVGSGNFHVTNALVRHGVRFVAARHEGGAATMADAYARMSGRVGVLTVHQGPGLTNAMTGITEAAKSRTPLIVLAPEATEPHSNFHIDQEAMARAVGALPMRITAADGAARDTMAAYRVAVQERRTVLLNLPLGVQPATAAQDEDWARLEQEARALHARAARDARSVPVDREAVARLRELLERAERPVFIAGRGARLARRELEHLADQVGALLATSAVAKGLWRGSPWDLDVSGGFCTPLAAELIRGADLVVGWGCALNMWTTKHGTLISPDTTVVQVDLEHPVHGTHVPVDLAVTGDAGQVARMAAWRATEIPGQLGDVVQTLATELGAVLDDVVRELRAAIGSVTHEERAPERAAEPPAGAGERRGYRSAELARRIAAEGRWRDVPYDDESGGGRIDPRTLTIGLDDLLPPERIIATDSGNFMGYPAMLLDVPDERGFCFTQAFQSIGLGLATAVGAALAQPDRLPVAALGDGGALMGSAELETVARLGLPMVIVVYDDEAYGAEVHHFTGEPLDTVTFPPVDLAAIARGHGYAAVTVTARPDLAGVADWLKGPRDRPLLVHAKVTREHGAWWLEEAFKGH